MTTDATTIPERTAERDDFSTCPRWCSGLHESYDLDGGILHASTCWELVVRDGDYPHHQVITVALGQSTADAVAGKTPLITMCVPDDEQQYPTEFGVAHMLVGADLTPQQALQPAKMLTAEAALAR